MDDIVASLSSVEVTAYPNNPHSEHPRFAMYKAKTSGSSQTERRNAVLSARKDARYDVIMHLRSIEEQDSDKVEHSDSEDAMDCKEQVERRCYARPKKYQNFLMMSEWLVDVPQDFAAEYLAVPCPEGRRNLVVSARGHTRAYSRCGKYVGQFPSLLPGGNHQTSPRGYALLDCIWSETNKTYYVLDIVLWRNQSVMECDTQFRFEWLKSRVEEDIEELQEFSRLNRYRFLRVPYYSCSTDSLTQLMNNPLPFEVPVDGVLFYHKESHYTHGPTPLVGWLKAYMFPEILGVPVSEALLGTMPSKYTSLPQYIQDSNKKREKWKGKGEKMEVADVSGKEEKAASAEHDMDTNSTQPAAR